MNFEIVADFDGTLTKKGPGCGTSFDAVDAVTPSETSEERNALFEKYGVKEFDFSIPLEERNRFMKEWWEKDFEIRTRGFIRKEMLESDVCLLHPVFRDGARELFTFAHTYGIPFLVFTAGFADIIEYKLQKEGLLFDNVCIIGNRFIFDEEGVVRDFVKPVIYIGNKHLIAREIEGKAHAKTVFLLGDHPTDASMCDDANHDRVIRFGFLNEKFSDREAFAVYNYLYDEKDASLEGVLEIVKKEVEKVGRS